MSAGGDRSSWRVRYEAGERTVVLAQEAGLTRRHMIRVLRGLGTTMRRCGGGLANPDPAPPPGYWEKLENGYPDEARRDWMRQQGQLWRWRGRP